MSGSVIGRTSIWEAITTPSTPLGAATRANGQTIPDYLEAARAAGVSNVLMNAQINRDYLNYGRAIQSTLFKEFRFDQQLGECIPNWFPIAFHVSLTVGDSMAGALAGLELLEEIKTHRLTPPDVFERLGASHNAGWLGRVAALWFNLLDIPHDVGALMLAALRMNYGALWKPHVLFMSVRRLKALLALARGDNPADRARDVLQNTVAMLGGGNQAVYLDIGVAFESFFEWQAAHATASGRAMIDASTFDVDKNLARGLFDLAKGATTVPYPIKRFAETAPMREGRALLLASAVLYQQAAQEEDAGTQRVLVRSANALLALREQRDLLQPAFNEEDDGSAIFQTLTPMLRVHFGRVVWNYSSFQLDPLVGNWGLFDDRWPAIMDAFEMLYESPHSAWRLPSPYGSWLLSTSPAGSFNDAESSEIVK